MIKKEIRLNMLALISNYVKHVLSRNQPYKKKAVEILEDAFFPYNASNLPSTLREILREEWYFCTTKNQQTLEFTGF